MSQRCRVLLVEDNAIDQRAVLKALNSLGVAPDVDVVNDGASAIAHLEQPALVPPDLILLDLNLPGTDGHDVLSWLNVNARQIPVIVITTSDAATDVERAYLNGANAYVAKPTTMAEWHRVANGIDAFWLSIVTFAPQ